MVLASGLGALVGLVLGLTGAGGGILAVPALVLGLGFSMTQATPVALVAVGLAALLGALDGLRKGLVRYKAAALMAILGSCTSPIGVAIAHKISNTWLATIFSAVMLLVAWRMYTQARTAGWPGERQAVAKPCMISCTTGKFIWKRKTFTILAFIGGISGILTGTLGVGGGFIIVPALKHFSNVSMHGIIATSLMVIALISATTVASSLMADAVIPVAAWPFILFAIIGMIAGRVACSHMPPSVLQIGFAAVATLVAVLLLVNTYLRGFM